MALETLSGLTEINGTKIVRERGVLSWDEFDEKRKEFPINITDDKNMISFRIQDGPVRENGKNGCQVDDMVAVAATMLEGLNKKFPCPENEKAIARLEEALMFLGIRTHNRQNRFVEGTSRI